MIRSVEGHYNTFFDPGDGRAFAGVFSVMVFCGLLEVAGVASVLPFFAVLMDPGLVQKNATLAAVYHFLGPSSANAFVLQMGFGIIAVMVISTVLTVANGWQTQRILWSVHDRLSEKVLTATLSRPYEELLDKDPATYSRSVLSDVEAVIVHYFYPISQILSRGIIVLVIVALISYSDPKMAVIVITVFGGLYFFIFSLCRRRLQELGRVRDRTVQSRFIFAAEIFSATKEIKVLSPDLHVIRQYIDDTKSYSRMMEQSTFFQAMPRPVIETAGLSGALLIVIVFVLRGVPFHDVLPSLVLFAVGGYRLLPSLQTLYSSLSMVRVFHPLFLRMSSELRRAVVQRTPIANDMEIERAPLADIIFQAVSYRYPRGDVPAVHNFSATFPVSKLTAVIGPSGAGKSTILDLLLGLLLPDSGTILIDGRPLDDAWVATWRNRLGYVPQQSIVLNASIAQNIAFSGTLDIDLDRVVRAARLARLDAYIKALPEGYVTRLGEGGQRLSGGQRQRLVIARALYRDPEILVMDEPTSALDQETQDAFMDSIDQLRRDKTVIVISHSPQVARIADYCVLIDGGRVVSEGSPQEVREQSALGRRLMGEG